MWLPDLVPNEHDLNISWVHYVPKLITLLEIEILRGKKRHDREKVKRVEEFHRIVTGIKPEIMDSPYDLNEDFNECNEPMIKWLDKLYSTIPSRAYIRESAEHCICIIENNLSQILTYMGLFPT